MNVYIVFAHPSDDSFNRHVLEAFTKDLTDAGHTFEIGDLYRMNFISEMDREFYQREVGLDPDAPLPDDVRAEQEKIDILKAVIICSAGHTVQHLQETGIAQSMRRIMLDDRLLGVGIKEARMEILGGMMPKDRTYWQENLRRAYEIGREL